MPRQFRNKIVRWIKLCLVSVIVLVTAAIISQCLPHHRVDTHTRRLLPFFPFPFFLFFWRCLSCFLFYLCRIIAVITEWVRDLHNGVTDFNYRRSTMQWRMEVIQLYFGTRIRRRRTPPIFRYFQDWTQLSPPPTTWTFIWKVCGFKYIFKCIYDIH